MPVYRIPVEFRRIAAPEKPALPDWKAPAPRVRWQADVKAPVWAALAHDAETGRLFVATDAGVVHALETAAARAGSTAPGPSTPARRSRRARRSSATRSTSSPTAASCTSSTRSSGVERWRRPGRRGDAGAPSRQRREVALGPLRLERRRRRPAPLRREPRQDAARARRRLGQGALEGVGRRHHDRDPRASGATSSSSPTTPARCRRSTPATASRAGATTRACPSPATSSSTPPAASSSAAAATTSIALDAATGKELWKHYYWFSWIESPPVVRGATVYTGSSDGVGVYAIDAATGARRWKARVPGWPGAHRRRRAPGRRRHRRLRRLAGRAQRLAGRHRPAERRAALAACRSAVAGDRREEVRMGLRRRAGCSSAARSTPPISRAASSRSTAPSPRERRVFPDHGTRDRPHHHAAAATSRRT